MEDGGVLKNFDSHYTAKSVKFTLKLQSGAKEKFSKDPAKFETMFKLSSAKNLSLNNIHLYGTNGAIKKYKDTIEVLKEWACVRIEKYLERKLHQLKTMEHEHKMISAKVRFIQEIIEGTLVVNNKKIAEVEAQLKAKKYPTSNETETGDLVEGTSNYNYLTRMPIYQLTYEKKKALEKEAHDLKMAIDALRAKPIQKIWQEELAEFKAAWEAHRNAMEEEYQADRDNKPVAGTKRKAVATKKK
jgi:DNA topoisomerase-2